MVLCLLCAAVVIILLIAKIYMLKKSAREIYEQFADRLKKDTNTPVCVSSTDKDIKQLADSINTQLAILRKEQLSYINGNNELKNSITNISHDLRTPLTTIRGYLDIAKKTGYKFVDLKICKDHYNIVMVKWLNECPYSNFYCNLQFTLRKAYKKLRFKPGRVKRFGV